MKTIKKCCLCNKEVKYLARHIRFEHKGYNIQKYYDIFLKEQNEGKCKLCNNPTEFKNLIDGYPKFCCKEHSIQYCFINNRVKPVYTAALKEKMSNSRKKYFSTQKGKAFIKKLSKDRMGKNNPVYKQTAETRKRMSDNNSIKMKEKIARGEFTPCITNSWANSKCKLYINNQFYRSSWEAAFQILNPNCQFEKLRLKYILDGKEYIYIVDFIDNIKKKVYEIKPKSEMFSEKFKAKMEALDKWCISHNYEFIIVTDDWFHLNANKIKYENYDPKIKKGMMQFLK